MKESTVTLDFDRYVPLSGLRFQVEQRDNFLRPVYIRGYRKERNGAAIYPDVVISQSMTLSSWEPTELHFDQVVVDSVVVVIRNFDDQPLDIQSIESFSNVKELIARTQEDGRYILTYGHSQIYAPVYDLEHFRNRIGTDVGSMDVGAEHLFDKMEEAEHSTVSHKWLWAVIVVAIVLIGIFTRKMMLPKE
jgi:hypothetical protein